MKYLFICRANVGRSQMAKALSDKLTGQESECAGATVTEEREGLRLGDLPGAEHVVECIKDVGVDLSGSRIKQVRPQMVDEADMVIVFTRRENLPDFVLNSGKVRFWRIEDPKGRSYVFHCKVRDHLKELVEKLVEGNA